MARPGIAPGASLAPAPLSGWPQRLSELGRGHSEALMHTIGNPVTGGRNEDWHRDESLDRTVTVIGYETRWPAKHPDMRGPY